MSRPCRAIRPASRPLVWTLLATVAATAAAAPVRAPTKLRVVVLPHLSYGVFYLARDLGHFAAQDLDVEFVKLANTNGAIPLLIKGDLDVMSVAPSPALFHAVASGERLRVVAGQSINLPGGCVASALIARTGVELAPGARGLRVSANRSNLAGYLLERLLESRGIDPSAQKFVDLSAAGEFAAMVDGQLDVSVLGQPWLQGLEEIGAARIVVATRDVLPLLHGSVALFGPRLLGDRELGLRFMRAYLAAIASYLEGATPRNVGILARALELEPGLLARSCWWPIRPSGELEVAPLEAYQRWEVARGNLDRVVSPAEYWDRSFVEQAARSPTLGSR